MSPAPTAASPNGLRNPRRLRDALLRISFLTLSPRPQLPDPFRLRQPALAPRPAELLPHRPDHCRVVPAGVRSAAAVRRQGGRVAARTVLVTSGGARVGVDFGFAFRFGPDRLLRRPARARGHSAVPRQRAARPARAARARRGGRPSLRVVRRRLADHRAHQRQADGLRRAAGGGRASAAGLRRHAQLASVPCRHAARDARRRRAARDRLHRGCAALVFELPAISRERGRGTRRAARAAAAMSTSPTSPAGSIIRCSSRPTPRTCARRCSACRSGVRGAARLVFTAHSIPLSMAERSRYREQLRESARLVARARPAWRDWALVYQSRSGRPEDPWLEPDVCDYLRAERATRPEAAVLCPIGFVCDHIEVLYDLDREAAESPRDRPADDARGSGQRRSALPRHDGRRRADDDSPIRGGKAVAITVRLKPDTPGLGLGDTSGSWLRALGYGGQEPDTTAIDIAILPPADVSASARCAERVAAGPLNHKDCCSAPIIFRISRSPNSSSRPNPRLGPRARRSGVCAFARRFDLRVTGGGKGSNSVWMSIERTPDSSACMSSSCAPLSPFEVTNGDASAFFW